MLLFLLFIIFLVLGFIFVPKLLKHHTRATVEDTTEHFDLSSLEASILRDIKAANPTAPRAHVLYLFCLKPIHPEIQREIAHEIIGAFPEGSDAYYNLYRILYPLPPLPPEEHPTEALDQLLRQYQSTQAPRARPAAPKPQQRPILRRPARAARRAPDSRAAPPPAPPRLQPASQPVEPPIFNWLEMDMLDLLQPREFLQQIHALDAFEEQRARRRAKHVYENQENVHAVSADCLKKAFQLANTYKSRATSEEIEKEISLLLLNAPVDKTDAISSALGRIRSDSASYGYKTEQFTMSQLFYAVVMYIKSLSTSTDDVLDVQIELQNRLYEELAESSKKCGTGHVNRLMNVLKGFDTPYDIVLPIKDEVYARVSILAQKAIEQSPDMDEILDSNPALVRFLQTQHADLARALVGEYESIADEPTVRSQVTDALNRYTKSTAF